MDNDHEQKEHISINDLLIATSVVACITAVSIPLAGIASDPNRFASTLGNHSAAILMLLCTFGIIGFPVAIGTIAYRVLRGSRSPLKAFYVLLAVASAIGSVYIAFVIGRACAGQIAG